MKLFGYTVDASVRDERLIPGPLDAPVLRGGSETGCLLLHGIGGLPANMRAIADALTAAGYAVSAPLLAGHGVSMADFARSTGEEWLRSAEDAYDALMETGCERIVVIGLSLGAILAGLLAEERENVAAAVLICPPVVMRGYLRFTRAVSFLLPYARYDGKGGENRPPNPYANMLSGMATRKIWDVSRLCRRLRTNLPRISCPLLAVEAQYDDKVDRRSFAILRDGAVNAASYEYILMERAAHGCTYGKERDTLCRKILAYLEETLS